VTSDDPFERAVRREAELRSTDAADRALLNEVERSARRSVVFFGVTLIAHAVLLRELTPWLVLHASLLVLSVMGAATFWNDRRRGRRAVVHRMLGTNVIVHGGKGNEDW
jgi:hypothetical protein